MALSGLTDSGYNQQSWGWYHWGEGLLSCHAQLRTFLFQSYCMHKCCSNCSFTQSKTSQGVLTSIHRPSRRCALFPAMHPGCPLTTTASYTRPHQTRQSSLQQQRILVTRSGCEGAQGAKYISPLRTENIIPQHGQELRAQTVGTVVKGLVCLSTSIFDTLPLPKRGLSPSTRLWVPQGLAPPRVRTNTPGQAFPRNPSSIRHELGADCHSFTVAIAAPR